MELENISLTCPICHDIFVDPVICSDGFSYCRTCIGEWVELCVKDMNSTWKSPRTNQTHKFPAILVTNKELQLVCNQHIFLKISRPIESFEVLQLEMRATTWRNSRPVAPKSMIDDILKRLHTFNIKKLGRHQLFIPGLFSAASFYHLNNFICDKLYTFISYLINSEKGSECATLYLPFLHLSFFFNLLDSQIAFLEKSCNKYKCMKLVNQLLDHIAWRLTHLDEIRSTRSNCINGVYIRRDNDFSQNKQICFQTEDCSKTILLNLTLFKFYETTQEQSVKFTMNCQHNIFMHSEVLLNLDAGIWADRKNAFCQEHSMFPDDDVRECEIERMTDTLRTCEDANESVIPFFEQVPKALPQNFEYSPFHDTNLEISQRNFDLQLRRQKVDFLLTNDKSKRNHKRRKIDVSPRLV